MLFSKSFLFFNYYYYYYNKLYLTRKCLLEIKDLFYNNVLAKTAATTQLQYIAYTDI